jgi:hypothetical protein
MYSTPDFSGFSNFISTVEGILSFLIILNIIVAIVIFVIAARLGDIKRMFSEHRWENQHTYVSLYHNGELKEFQGKKSEAIDCYMEALFILNKRPNKNAADNNNILTLKGKINSLGGNTPA